MDKVSVITICLNEEKNIKQTLESVLNQTYTEIEYIIKDGGSTDATNEIIKKTIESYKGRNIKHIIQKDAGIYDAMNQAVDYCTGDWVIFMNSGDLFKDMQTLKNIFLENSYTQHGVLYGDAIVRDEQGDSVWRADFTKIEKGMPFCHQSCLIRRKFLEKYPFNTDLKIAADYNNILDLYKEGVLFYDLQMCVSVFDLMGISSTNFVQRYKEKRRVQFEHKVGNMSRVNYKTGMLIEIIKTYIMRYCPKNLLNILKKIYKSKIKKYERNSE